MNFIETMRKDGMIRCYLTFSTFKLNKLKYCSSKYFSCKITKPKVSFMFAWHFHRSEKSMKGICLIAIGRYHR